MPKYVYSKLANDYVINQASYPEDGKLPRIERQIVIKGGAGVITKNLITPAGVVTEITDDEAEWLKTNTSFIKQSKAGFLKLEGTSRTVEKAVSDMTDRDNSDQLQEIDFEENKAPKAEVTGQGEAPKARTRKVRAS